MKNNRPLLLIYCLMLIFALTPYSSSAKEKKYSTGLRVESQDELDANKSMPRVRSDSRKLPSSVDLSSKMPPVGSQGSQGSCTAWSTTYYVKSYHEKIKNKWKYQWGNYPSYTGQLTADKGVHVFSPAWTYNQLNDGSDDGICIGTALHFLTQKGAVPWSVMPYTDEDYLKQPDSSMKKLALSKYKSKDYEEVDTSDPENIKREIAAGNPVVGGFDMSDKFMDGTSGKVFDDYTGPFDGAHAMAIVGYDDNKVSPKGHRGAFKIVNSWGNEWADKGYIWMSYKCLAMMCKYSYVLYDSDASDIEPERNDEIVIKPTTMVTASKGNYSDKVNISWNEVENAVSYIVERSFVNSDNFSTTAVVNTNSYSDTSIETNFRYNYRIISVGEYGRSSTELSPVAEGFALEKSIPMPEQVTDLSGSSVSGSSVSLKWNKVENARSYRVIRYNQTNKNWDFLKEVKSNSFTDKSPQKKLPNFYYVAAVNQAGQGKWSSIFKISVTAVSGPPSIVSGITASNGTYSDRIKVEWDNVPSAEYYEIYRWNNSTEDWDRNWTVKTNVFIDQDSDIQDGEEHFYTVKAYNKSGESEEWSTYAAGSTGMSVSMGSGIKISAPDKFRTAVNEKKRTVSLFWKKSTAAAGYNIYRKKENNKKFTLIKTLPKGISSFSEKFPGKDGDIFMYYITAKTAANESERSEISSATIIEFNPTVMTTFVAGDGLKNFRGTWRATHQRPGGKISKMEIVIVNKGSRFTAKMKYGSRKRIIRGDYASKSRYLEAKNFSFKMLPAFDNDVANVVIPAGVFTPSRIVLNFARENQD